MEMNSVELGVGAEEPRSETVTLIPQEKRQVKPPCLGSSCTYLDEWTENGRQ